MWQLLVLRSFARAAAADDRPVMLSVVCILGFYSGFSNMFFSLLSSDIWLVAFVFVYGALTLMCMIALWRMRRWAIIAYAFIFGISQFAQYEAGKWPGPEILFSSTILAVGIYYFRELE